MIVILFCGYFLSPTGPRAFGRYPGTFHAKGRPTLVSEPDFLVYIPLGTLERTGCYTEGKQRASLRAPEVRAQWAEVFESSGLLQCATVCDTFRAPWRVGPSTPYDKLQRDG